VFIVSYSRWLRLCLPVLLPLCHPPAPERPEALGLGVLRLFYPISAQAPAAEPFVWIRRQVSPLS